MVKAYSGWKVPTLSEYGFIFVLSCMIQELCVEKKWIYLSRFYGSYLFLFI